MCLCFPQDFESVVFSPWIFVFHSIWYLWPPPPPNHPIPLPFRVLGISYIFPMYFCLSESLESVIFSLCIFVFQSTWNRWYFPYVSLSFRVDEFSDISPMCTWNRWHFPHVYMESVTFPPYGHGFSHIPPYGHGFGDISPVWTWNRWQFPHVDMESVTFPQCGHGTGDISPVWTWNRWHFPHVDMESVAFPQCGHGTGDISPVWTWNRWHFPHADMESAIFSLRLFVFQSTWNISHPTSYCTQTSARSRKTSTQNRYDGCLESDWATAHSVQLFRKYFWVTV